MVDLYGLFYSPFKGLPNRLFLFVLYFSIIFGPSFILAKKSRVCLSYLEERFVLVKDLKPEILNVYVQYVYMTKRTGYC